MGCVIFASCSGGRWGAVVEYWWDCPAVFVPVGDYPAPGLMLLDAMGARS